MAVVLFPEHEIFPNWNISKVSKASTFAQRCEA
jgi:hypothetical protein